jgi:hypothetical protein
MTKTLTHKAVFFAKSPKHKMQADFPESAELSSPTCVVQVESVCLTGPWATGMVASGAGGR